MLLGGLSVVSGVLRDLVNYWPVKNGVMADVIGSVSTTSASPTFTTDRFGNANGAILSTNMNNFWTVANGVYMSGDYTITAWVKNLQCNLNNRIGIYYKQLCKLEYYFEYFLFK